MRRVTLSLLVAMLAAAPLALALNPGTDLLVAAASRGEGQNQSLWRTDLYLFNPGEASVAATVSWLVRNQANPSPASETFTVLPGETLVLDDVVQETFGLAAGNGALRVVADGEVVVNSRIYNLKGQVTFGQGFAGVPRSSAVAAGGSTDVVGLAQNASFRSNVALLDASGSGATVALSLRDPAGTELASATSTLGAFEPRLLSVGTLFPGLTFDAGTLHAEVTAGSALILASKVDNDAATGDPTTLEGWTPLGAALSVDGTYRVVITDSDGWSTGGVLVIAGGEVTSFTATYMNWDKVDGQDEPACTLVFALGGPFEPPVGIDELETGVTWSDEPYPEGGHMTWTLALTVDQGLDVTGTIGAEGAEFPAADSGCNGAFPSLTVRGGKSAN